MSSTDIDTPPLRLIIMAIVIVVVLHVLTAVALVAMKPSKPKIDLPENTTPIEIEMVTLPAAIEVSKNELSKNEVQDAQPVEVSKTPSKSVAIDEVMPKPQPVEKPTPIEQPNTVVKAPVKQEPNDETSELKSEANKQPEKPKAIEYEPFSHHVNLPDSASMEIVDKSPTINELKMLTAKAKANAEEQAKLQEAERVNKAIADAIEEKAAEVKAAEEAAAANATLVSAEAAAAAVSNTPQNFSAGDAQMIKTPRFSVPASVLRTAKTGDTFNVLLKVTVDKQGRVSDVLLVGESGNNRVDKEAIRKMHSARFRPFTKNGVPVVGIVTLPVSHIVD